MTTSSGMWLIPLNADETLSSRIWTLIVMQTWVVNASAVTFVTRHVLVVDAVCYVE